MPVIVVLGIAAVGWWRSSGRTPEPRELPAYLRQLWITEDEKTFDSVPLPRDRMAFKGMVFASDGALLVAEAEDPRGYCGEACRAGRIWHLPPGGTELKPLAGAPRLTGSYLDGGLEYAGGGVIVAHTGRRTAAVSTDGYTWTQVTPAT